MMYEQLQVAGVTEPPYTADDAVSYLLYMFMFIIFRILLLYLPANMLFSCVGILQVVLSCQSRYN